MSIDKVEVLNEQGNLLTLSLEDTSNGYEVHDITGLDPVKSTIVTSRFATLDGQQYQASSREVRNIGIELGFQPDISANQTVRALRSHLYQFFMTDTAVSLKFYMDDGLEVTTSGRVESCEASMFTREPQINISILCFDPDFVDPNLVEMHSTFYTTDGAPHEVLVSGTVPTGLTSVSFTANKTLEGFSLYHTAPSGELEAMVISTTLLANDFIKLSTVKGQKTITRTRAGVTSSLMFAVSPQSPWILLKPGMNGLYLNADVTGGTEVFVDYYNRYGGL